MLALLEYERRLLRTLYNEESHVLQLGPVELSALKLYKYQSVDKSPLSKYILNPWWNWAAQFMPPWLAPNVITLIGIGAIYFNILCVEIWMPDFQTPGPSWLYYSFALGLFFYQTMDNIDGKQARKTGSSSPLGELFDHGIDSLNCCLGGLVESACMGLGPGKAAAWTTFSTTLAMYFSTWETYHTHVLYLGYVNGPTEGIVIAVLVMVLTGLFGQQLWLKSMGEVFGSLAPSFLSSVSLRDVWIITVVFGVLVCHIPVCAYNVYRAQKKQIGRAVQPVDLFIQLIPLAAFSLSLAVWLLSPYACILRNNHLLIFALTISTVFARTSTAIILSHLCRLPFPFWSLSQLPLFFGSFVFGALPYVVKSLQNINPIYEEVYLWGYFIFSVVYFYQYASYIINSLCSYLDINCFSIKSKGEKKIM